MNAKTGELEGADKAIMDESEAEVAAKAELTAKRLLLAPKRDD